MDSRRPPVNSMAINPRTELNWFDLLWLLFLSGLALLPPVSEGHKQFIVLACGVLQLVQSGITILLPHRGHGYGV